MVKLLFPGSICPILLFIAIIFFYSQARAEEESDRWRLVFNNDAAPVGAYQDGYHYRRVNHEKTIAIMLYGFQSQDSAAELVPKERKNLNGFFKQHLDRIKNDYFSDSASMRIVAGDAAFTSTAMNRGSNIEPAKMAGVSIPFGKLTFGGGYLWGERNPALMQRTDGLFGGFSYDTGDTGFQVSYIASGRDTASREIGIADIKYRSLMFGTSFRVNDKISLTATAQWRDMRNSLVNDDQDAVFTVGTRWKF